MQLGIYLDLHSNFARIAQLVEHDLAKVGVAGSNPVSRSSIARVVESVDTPDLKSCALLGVRVQVPPRVQSPNLIVGVFCFYETCQLASTFDL